VARCHARRRQQGLCVVCGQRALAGYSTCQDHLRRVTARPRRTRMDLWGLWVTTLDRPIEDADDRAQLARIRAWAVAAGVTL